MLLEELRRGAVGTMTGFGFPELLVEIVGRYRAGDEAGARATFHRIMPLIRFENQPGINLAIRKHLYQRRGCDLHGPVGRGAIWTSGTWRRRRAWRAPAGGPSGAPAHRTLEGPGAASDEWSAAEPIGARTSDSWMFVEWTRGQARSSAADATAARGSSRRRPGRWPR